MKDVRLVCSVFAVTLVAGWAAPSMACDNEKTTATAVQATATCPASMAAKCTPEMKAACTNAKAAKAASVATAMDDCCANKSKNATAKTKSKPKNTSIIYVNGSPDAQNTVVLASSDGANASTAGKSVAASTEGSCASKSTAAYTASASNGSCASKSASATAVNASSSGAKKSSSSCSSKSTSTSASASSHCSAQGMAVMAGMGTTENCEACFDMVACGDALTAVGAHRQTVRLKNGVMYVFTADSQRDVNAVQAAVARRGDQMSRVLMAGDNVKLCGGCKSIRGAIASGKLTREVVNIEGGTLTLITSSDAELVSRLHTMTTDTKVAARIKS